MTTSGTTSFNPSIGEATLYAFNQAGVRPTEITQSHMTSARMAANLVLADWANKQVNLWKVELVTQALTAGTTAYTVDPSVVLILDAYIETGSGTTTTDRIILPVSRSVYATYPNKLEQGIVTTYWHDRLIDSSVNLYLTPDGTQPTLKYYAVQQMQDAAFTNAQTLDVPYTWLTAFIDALSFRLALVWNPEKAAGLKALSDETYAAASTNNIETDSIYLAPQLGGYFT